MFLFVKVFECVLVNHLKLTGPTMLISCMVLDNDNNVYLINTHAYSSFDIFLRF